MYYERGYGGVNSNTKNLAVGIKNWIGSDAKIVTNQAGDKIFISKDGLYKIRFDINNPTPHNNPHAHFEGLVNGRWKSVDSNISQVYPYDVPHN